MTTEISSPPPQHPAEISHYGLSTAVEEANRCEIMADVKLASLIDLDRAITNVGDRTVMEAQKIDSETEVSEADFYNICEGPFINITNHLETVARAIVNRGGNETTAHRKALAGVTNRPSAYKRKAEREQLILSETLKGVESSEDETPMSQRNAFENTKLKALLVRGAKLLDSTLNTIGEGGESLPSSVLETRVTEILKNLHLADFADIEFLRTITAFAQANAERRVATWGGVSDTISETVSAALKSPHTRIANRGRARVKDAIE